MMGPVAVDPVIDTLMNVAIVAFIGFLIWLYARKD